MDIMTETKETPRVRGAEFFKMSVNLSPELIYSRSSFDECEIFIQPGDKMPESGCHIEKCTIHLHDGVTQHNFLGVISQMKGSRVYGAYSSAVWEKGPDFPTGSVWIDCKIVVDGVERDMMEMLKEIKEKIYGKELDEMAWWEDQIKQRAERLSRAQ
jgi:hypothetical protein